MRLFYDPEIIDNASSQVLSEEESKHILRVLRLKEGDQIGILNGKGYLFTCSITGSTGKRCEVMVTERNSTPKKATTIHIAISPTKQSERMEWFVEKATELGVDRITFLETKNGERSKVNLDRMLRKAISAMKQSKQLWLPQLDVESSFDRFISANGDGLIAHCYDEPKEEFSSVFKTTVCPILIGPEGDFTPEEVSNALQNGFRSLNLGQTRLRTETAALYACALAKKEIEK